VELFKVSVDEEELHGYQTMFTENEHGYQTMFTENEHGFQFAMSIHIESTASVSSTRIAQDTGPREQSEKEKTLTKHPTLLQ